MQIINSVDCDTSKGSLLKQIESPLVGEHAFPPAGFVCKTAHVTFGDSGRIMSSVRLTNAIPRPSLGTRGVQSQIYV